MDTATLHGQPSGLRLERSLRRAGHQTDELTLSIARSQRSLERFAGEYGLDSLLASQARATFAAMSSEECGHIFEFLQYALHVGRSSMQTREQWEDGPAFKQDRCLTYLAAVVDKPGLVAKRARDVFQSMNPEGRRMVAMMLLTAWQVAKQSPGLQDITIKADVIDRIVAQLGGAKLL